MVRTMRVGLLLSCFLLVTVEYAEADLYISQVGDGNAPAAITNAGALFLRKFSDSGSDLATVALPSAVNGAIQPITNRYNSTTEGEINASTDGKYILFGGYATAPGLNNPDTAAVARVIQRVKTSDLSTDQMVFSDSTYAGSSFRSVASTNGTDLWMSGNASSTTNDGSRYTTFGSTTSVQLTSVNGRSTGIYNDAMGNPQLYMSTASGSFNGVNTVGTGLPTTAGQALTILPGVLESSGNTISFWFKDFKTLYKADGRTVASGGGIQRWDLNTETSTWGLSYTLPVNGASAQGVTGTVVGGNTVLYSTSFNDELVTITDTGAGSTSTLLASAGANKHWRGIAFVNATPAGVQGDYNNNGIVDAADYVLWRNGGPLANDPTAGVQATDYDFWRSRFNATSGSGSGSGAAVPEPASAVLLMIGLATLGWRRRAS